MIIADTGFWVAFFNHGDDRHLRARECVRNLREPLITTLPVVTETCYLLQQRGGVSLALVYVGCLRQGGYHLFQTQNTALERIEQLLRQYANLPIDFADASLVVLADTLGHGRILSTDRRDFDTYRWRNQYPFTNLLFENT
ncbi:MAG: PIN domain-containing protein [Candidatus Competibacter sp.]